MGNLIFFGIVKAWERPLYRHKKDFSHLHVKCIFLLSYLDLTDSLSKKTEFIHIIFVKCRIDDVLLCVYHCIPEAYEIRT